MQTEQMLHHGYASGLDMAVLLGHWTWALLVQRPALAIFNAIYRFVMVANYRRFSIWPTVRRELEVVVALAPLLQACIGASWYGKIVASDSSSIGLGVVAASADPVDLVHIIQSPEPADMVDQFRWSTIVSSSWRYAEHINVLELRALATSIRWILSHPSSIGRRVILLSDSSVVVGAVSKGRSSSQPLLRRLRAISALVLASGLQLHVKWIPSELNPADEPSRRFTC